MLQVICAAAYEVGSEILPQQGGVMPRDGALRVPSVRTVWIRSGWRGGPVVQKSPAGAGPCGHYGPSSCEGSEGFVQVWVLFPDLRSRR